ncbi:MAG: hypothetical protein A2283_11040 [Lentisphaerae bacterium RIFOXYA12_FULL_48_11]|nr:MAG: hypothetical protein A2283_11040 [Lentisphaerae bacterium RIFOXYA12_FULL_48_11]
MYMQSNTNIPAGITASLLIIMACGFTQPLLAQTNNYAAATKTSDYPVVNTVTWYEVDPNWPQRPAGMPWGQISGLAIDKQDNIWINTRTNPAVQVYAPDGRFIRSWNVDNPKSIAHGLRVDTEGNVWLVDVGLQTVTKRSPSDGKVLLTLGTEGVSGCDDSHFFKPTDLAFSLNGDIFVTDGYGNARVVHFDKSGRYINSWGKLGTEPGCFSIPHNVVCDSKDRAYIADRNNARIQVFDFQGKLLDSWNNLLVPWGLWISPKDEIWVCGSSPMVWGFDPKYPTAPLGCPPKDQLIMRFNTDGKLLQLWTFPKAEDGMEKPGTLNWLHCIALDTKENVYCTDIIGSRVQKFIKKTDPQYRGSLKQ